MKSTNGFTLVELMMVVVIVGILMSIGLPSYRDYVLRSHRTEAHSSLVDIAARQERFVAQRNAYTDLISPANGLNMGTTTTPEGHYTLSAEACANGTLATCYLITATAAGGQRDDTECTAITYDSTGTKAPAACW